MDHCSDPAGTESCNMQIRWEWCWGTWLSPLPSQWKIAGTPDWSGLVSPPIASVFVGSRLAMVLLPPALFKKGEEGRKKKEVLHLSRCYTHTHPAEPGKPWKARGRKKRTHDGPTAKNSAGRRGEQTDLRNQPTRRNGPDKTRAHT